MKKRLMCSNVLFLLYFFLFFLFFYSVDASFFFWLFFQLITNQKKEWWTSYTSTFFFVSSGNGSHILFSFWAVALVVPISMTHSYTLSCQYYYYYYYPHYPSTLSSHTYPGQQNNSLCWCSSNSLHSSQVFIFFSFFPMKLHGILFALFFLVHFFCVCVCMVWIKFIEILYDYNYRYGLDHRMLIFRSWWW